MPVCRRRNRQALLALFAAALPAARGRFILAITCLASGIVRFDGVLVGLLGDLFLDPEGGKIAVKPLHFLSCQLLDCAALLRARARAHRKSPEERLVGKESFRPGEYSGLPNH